MVILQLFVLVQAVAAIQVSTKNGKLKGDYIRNQNGGGYYAFMGIPYAQPITANFSSKDPQPTGKWNGVRDATFGWLSSNNLTRGTEDCHYLSVYTRKIRRWLPPTMVQTYQASPVEVYFKGCIINIGGKPTKSESDNILKNDVVEVWVNHRQRVSNSSGERPDMLLQDQLLALQWVKDNIVYFGGDPQRVALFQGHSGLGDIDINRLFVQSLRT